MILHAGLARRLLGLAFALGLLVPPAGSSRAAPLMPLPAQPPDVAWPTKQWPTGPLAAAVSRPVLEELLAVVGKRHERLGETRAVVIVQGGRLVLERYASGFGPDTAMISWSVAQARTSSGSSGVGGIGDVVSR